MSDNTKQLKLVQQRQEAKAQAALAEIEEKIKNHNFALKFERLIDTEQSSLEKPIKGGVAKSLGRNVYNQKDSKSLNKVYS